MISILRSTHPPSFACLDGLRERRQTPWYGLALTRRSAPTLPIKPLALPEDQFRLSSRPLAHHVCGKTKIWSSKKCQPLITLSATHQASQLTVLSAPHQASQAPSLRFQIVRDKFDLLLFQYSHQLRMLIGTIPAFGSSRAMISNWRVGRPHIPALYFCESNNSAAYFDIELEEIKDLIRREMEENSEDESDDRVSILDPIGVAELDATTMVDLNAELNALSSGDEQTTETPSTAAQISAHNGQAPTDYHDNQAITQEPTRALKRRRTNSSGAMIPNEVYHDDDEMERQI